MPPEPFDRLANLETWETGKAIIRVHHSAFGATEFNRGKGNGRFHPLIDRTGTAIATIYGSNTLDGALSETIFHDVPASGPGKAIEQSLLMPMLSCTLRPLRPLRLVQLRGFGLRKLGLTHMQMVESDADQYSATRAWAVALYNAFPVADGLIWMSRQHDSSEAIVLFGTRVQRNALEVMAAPRSLYPPSPGWLDVLAAAEAADITINMA